MDWSLPTIIRIGLRLIAMRGEIEALMRRIMAVVATSNTLWRDTQKLLHDIDPQLAAALTGAPVLAEAAPTYDVRWLQETLNTLIGANLTVDGVMGPRTQEAIQRFQTSRGLQPDGWAGALTESFLDAGLRGLRHAGRSR